MRKRSTNKDLHDKNGMKYVYSYEGTEWYEQHQERIAKLTKYYEDNKHLFAEECLCGHKQVAEII